MVGQSGSAEQGTVKPLVAPAICPYFSCRELHISAGQASNSNSMLAEHVESTMTNVLLEYDPNGSVSLWEMIGVINVSIWREKYDKGRFLLLKGRGG